MVPVTAAGLFSPTIPSKFPVTLPVKSPINFLFVQILPVASIFDANNLSHLKVFPPLTARFVLKVNSCPGIEFGVSESPVKSIVVSSSFTNVIVSFLINIFATGLSLVPIDAPGFVNNSPFNCKLPLTVRAGGGKGGGKMSLVSRPVIVSFDSTTKFVKVPTVVILGCSGF